jgi:hypothetical protein
VPAWSAADPRLFKYLTVAYAIIVMGCISSASRKSLLHRQKRLQVAGRAVGRRMVALPLAGRRASGRSSPRF